MPILLFVGQLQVKKKQLILILILMCIFSVSFLLNLVINKEDFYFRLATQASIKVAFYMFIVAIFLNYIKRNQYEELFLTINNIFAVIIILIGLYIVFSIYNDHEYPYRLLWKFTREDYKSYYFNGNSNFIRMRSIFSEPAHLGFYLNVLVTSNLVNKKFDLKRVIYLTIMCLGVFLTFSYSMIFTLFVIIFIYFTLNIDYKNFRWNKYYSGAVFLFLSISYLFKSYIYETIIKRTLNIFNGSDGSSYNRLIESWVYVDTESWWFGNGINHTPVITNNFAYMLSDLGLFGLTPFLFFAIWVINRSILFGILFILLNFSRGGYLGPSIWLFMLFILIYSPNKRKMIS